ncbi:MAG: hypothetical protein FWD64_05210 [Acidobacteriaceae bacterium]|nr:hypothetical protein [Acidobacteriaceae bacterium]
MFRNLITITGVVQHDSKPSDSQPSLLSTHVRPILPKNALSFEMKGRICIGQCKVVFQSSLSHIAARIAQDDILLVSGYLVTGYVRDSNITTNKIVTNYAAILDKDSFSESDHRNQIEISGILSSDPVEIFQPFPAWSVPLSPHLSPELRTSAIHPFKRYQVVFSERIQDKAHRLAKSDLVLISGHFIPSCLCHQKTSINRILANSMTRIDKSHTTKQPELPSTN